MSERRKTVLIVDVDEVTREALSAVLRRDYRVLKAGTGETALQIMENDDVDLMLLDAGLPGISGLELLRIVKENHPHVEVVVVSAVQALDAARRASGRI
jgi:DNA-binding response OmpR family regulator